MKCPSSLGLTAPTTQNKYLSADDPIGWLRLTCYAFLTNITKRVRPFRKNERHNTVTNAFYSPPPP